MRSTNHLGSMDSSLLLLVNIMCSWLLVTHMMSSMCRITLLVLCRQLCGPRHMPMLKFRPSSQWCLLMLLVLLLHKWCVIYMLGNLIHLWLQLLLVLVILSSHLHMTNRLCMNLVCASLTHNNMWWMQLLMLHRHGMHVQLRCTIMVVLVLLLLLLTDSMLLLGTGCGHLMSL